MVEVTTSDVDVLEEAGLVEPGADDEVVLVVAVVEPGNVEENGLVDEDVVDVEPLVVVDDDEGIDVLVVEVDEPGSVVEVDELEALVLELVAELVDVVGGVDVLELDDVVVVVGDVGLVEVEEDVELEVAPVDDVGEVDEVVVDACVVVVMTVDDVDVLVLVDVVVLTSPGCTSTAPTSHSAPLGRGRPR